MSYVFVGILIVFGVFVGEEMLNRLFEEKP